MKETRYLNEPLLCTPMCIVRKPKGEHLTILDGSAVFFFDIFFGINICSYSSVDSRSLLVGFL